MVRVFSCGDVYRGSALLYCVRCCLHTIENNQRNLVMPFRRSGDNMRSDAALGLSAVISSPDPWELLYGEYDSSFAFAIAHTPEEVRGRCALKRLL